MSERLVGSPIDEVLHNNWNAFEQWRNQTGAEKTLDIPQEVADVFVPRRILEIAEDPTQVHTIITEHSPSSLGFWVYETKNHEITDLEDFKNYRKQQTKEAAQIITDSQDQVLSTIDYKHLSAAPLLEQGIISGKDKLYVGYLADVIPGFPNTVITRTFEDRKELQRQGIGTSFFDRLEAVLKDLEFKYSAGQVVSPHPQFFEKRRTLYRDLPEEIKREIPPEFPEGQQDTRFLVKIL